MHPQEMAAIPSADAGAPDVSRLHGRLAEAESSLLVHLELYAWLGNEAAMAAAYGHLGRLYEQLGDRSAALAMRAAASRLAAARRG